MYDNQPQAQQPQQASQMPQLPTQQQMQQPVQQQPVQQQMAHGGKATAKGHYVMGHFSKAELPMLDEWQGGASYIPGTKIRHYKNLEKRFKGDHLFSGALDSHLDEHTKSGKIHELRERAAYMKKMGRNGDSEAALIGPKTRAYLDHYVKEAKEDGRARFSMGGDVNPGTEAPEYFNLGSVLSGIGSRISPYVKSAGNWLGNKVGAGDLGTKATDLGGQAMDNFIKPVGNFVGQFAKPLGNAIGQKYGMGDLGDQIEGVGGQADQMLNPDGEQEGPPTQTQSAVQGAIGTAQHGINKAQEFMDSPLGQNLGKSAQGAYDAYKGGAGAKGAALSGVNSFAGNYDNPASRAAQGAIQSYQTPGNTGGFRKHAAEGVASALGQNSPAARAGAAVARTAGNRGSVRDMARAGFNSFRPQQSALQ